MKLEHLISAVNKDPHKLVQAMHLQTDGVIINQTDETKEETFQINDAAFRCFHRAERGVGRSRNLAIANRNKEADICLFSDEDIVYEEGYVERILKEFEAHPEADLLLFNVQVVESRRTYWNEDYHRVRWHNYGRYPAYSIAIRQKVLGECNLQYSELFGGGAPYSAGEDSVFLHDCLKSGVKMYATPVCIGSEKERPSTWFQGYTEKFFYDRGVLYYFLYGPLKYLFSFRFIWIHRKQMCQEIPVKKAYQLMKEGIRKAKTL